MSAPQVVLITGANRGIGFSLLKLYATNPSTTIFAGIRDESRAEALKEFAKTSAAEIHLIKLDSGDEDGNKKAAQEVASKVGHIDVLIANAGGSSGSGPVAEVSIASFEANFKTNTLGPIVLFQSFWPLLSKAKNGAPKFIVISSAAGSVAMNSNMNFPIGSYGTSKAAVNYFTVKLHTELEVEKLIAVPIHPGLVSTDLGLSGMRNLGITDPAAVGFPIITPEESATAVKKIIDDATRETVGGKFVSYDGNVLPW